MYQYREDGRRVAMIEKVEITDITSQKKATDRVNIFVDGNYFGSMYVDMCIKHGIKKGLVIELDKLNDIMLESDKEIALNKTAKYISAKMKTKKEVRDYLYSKEYSKVVVDYVIGKLVEYKYLDDENYVIAYVNTYKSKYGVLKMKNNLILKGIDAKYLEEFFAEYETDMDIIFAIAEKYMKNKENTYDNLSKLYRHLASRGYSYDEISVVVNKFKGE